MLLFAPIRWALKLIYFAVLAAVVYVVVSAFQVVTASHLPTSAAAMTPADAIVVLGAPVSGNAPGPDLTNRLQQALLLYEAKRAGTVVVTGVPASPGEAAQATVARTWLVANGVPANKVVEVSASDAATSLAQVPSVLGLTGVKAIVVTDAIDALWTKGAGSKAGLTVQISPALGSEKAFYHEFGPLWEQATGVAVGRILGYANATWAAQ